MRDRRPPRGAAAAENALVLRGRALASSEAALVAELKARLPDAWTSLYDAHYRQLYRYAFARVGDRETAEDIAATVFSRALTAIDCYRCTGRPLLAWLYGIARNVLSEHRRRPAALPWRREGREESGTDSDPVRFADSIDLRDALARLTSDQREAIILRYVVGLSAREAGAVLGRPEGAVYSLQSRALAALRRYLRVT